jgi:hypothetical protein
MGYWENTTYINHDSVEDVSRALTSLFKKEGMAEIFPAERERLAVEPMQYEGALGNDLWGVAIFPGAAQWTAIKTAPLELLGERRSGGSCMRLVELCLELQASAIQLHIYDGSGTVLVEVSDAGNVFLSGFNPYGEAPDPLCWNGERLSEEFFEAQFQLHPFQGLFAEHRFGDDVAKALAHQLGGGNARYCDNLVSVDTLIGHKPFDAPGGKSLYFQWPGPSRQRFKSCSSWDEFRTQIGH